MTRALKHPPRIAETPEAARKLRTAQPSDAAQASPALLLQASLQRWRAGRPCWGRRA